jgi:hypothetical protein
MFFLHLLMSEDNTWTFISIYLSLKTTHGCFFLIYLSLKATHGCFFLIYLSLKTTYLCLFSFYLIKFEDNTWMFFSVH